MDHSPSFQIARLNSGMELASLSTRRGDFQTFKRFRNGFFFLELPVCLQGTPVKQVWLVEGRVESEQKDASTFCEGERQYTFLRAVPFPQCPEHLNIQKIHYEKKKCY